MHWEDTGWGWDTRGETLQAAQACYHFGNETLVGHGDLDSALWPVTPDSQVHRRGSWSQCQDPADLGPKTTPKTRL